MFEDLPDEDSSEDEEPPRRSLSVTEEDDNLSFTDLDEKESEIDPLAEIEKNATNETLVLNL